MVILIISLVVNPMLFWGKYRTGKQLESEALIADSKETLICLYQTFVVLSGLLLNATLAWWWAGSQCRVAGPSLRPLGRLAGDA